MLNQQRHGARSRSRTAKSRGALHASSIILGMLLFLMAIVAAVRAIALLSVV